jgi:transcriptional regulator with XRE-family HTH domain
MSYRDYISKRREDPEYREAERRLKPILDLADDILYLRLEKGWTQAELAKRVGTKQANISRLENGLANPTFKFLQKLSEVFGTDLTVSMRHRPVAIQANVVQANVVYISSNKRYDELAELEYSIAPQPSFVGEVISSDIGVT